MAQCDPIIQCKPIVECTTTLTLFDPPLYMGATIYAYIENMCNGHVLRYETTVDYEGLLSVAINQNLMVDCLYRLWINDSETNPQETTDFVIGTETTDKIEFSVFKMYEGVDYTTTTGFTSQLALLV